MLITNSKRFLAVALSFFIMLAMSRGSLMAASANGIDPVAVRSTEVTAVSGITIRVIDQRGRTVRNAEAMALDAIHDVALFKTWKPIPGGGRSFTRDEFKSAAGNNCRLVVRAPGYGWATQDIAFGQDGPPEEQSLVVTLTAGKQLQLVLSDAEGRKFPEDFQPIIFTSGQSVAAWYTGVQLCKSATDTTEVFSAAIAEREPSTRQGLASYKFQVPDSCDSLYVLINHFGFLRAFQAGPFGPEEIDSGVLEVALPSPAKLVINLAPNKKTPHDYQNCGVELRMSPQIPEGGWSFPMPADYSNKPTLRIVYDDLAPRDYHVAGFTGTQKTRPDKSRSDYFETQSWVDLTSSGEDTVSLELETFDESFSNKQLQGAYELRLTIINADGSPASGKTYELYYSLSRFARQVPAAKGVVPSDGQIALSNLPSSIKGLLTLNVEGRFGKHVILQGDDNEVTVEFRLPPAIGERAPEIDMQRAADSKVIKLSAFRGQIVYLEFWASWCGPCQAPMAHCNEVMSRRQIDWKGKATIIGLSIDDSADVISDHVQARGFGAVQQMWAGEGGWKCDAVSRYGVSAIPAAFLIDERGIVVWAGSPEGDVEQEIDDLLSRSK